MDKMVVTIVTQTRPLPGQDTAFANWQSETSKIIASFAGFIRQTIIPSAPPTQLDWVILQSFVDRNAAINWLKSDIRAARVVAAGALIAGQDDVHIVTGDGSNASLSPVSAVISTRIKPGREAEYRIWEKQISTLQAQSTGFQGYRLQSPIPGVQEDWLAIVRFDSAKDLQAWLDSPDRRKLLEQSSAFTEEVHTRIARTGFGQWFDLTKKDFVPAPAWKQNMLVLLNLYPVVFIFGALVQTPFLMRQLNMPFALALFIGNLVSICILNYSVPLTSRLFKWWLQPSGPPATRLSIAGFALLSALNLCLVAAFCLLN